MINQLLKQTI